jgi:hypothetical protein
MFDGCLEIYSQGIATIPNLKICLNGANSAFLIMTFRNGQRPEKVNEFNDLGRGRGAVNSLIPKSYLRSAPVQSQNSMRQCKVKKL